MSAVSCPFCVTDGPRPVLAGRADREFGVTARLTYFRCRHRDCRHVFAHPVPEPSVLLGFYANYTTHDVPQGGGIGGAMRRLDAAARGRAFQALRRSIAAERVRILDFGCGNGASLAALARYGADDLVGFDPDPEAVRCARGLGLRCFQDLDEIRRIAPFDLIVLHHVIEHVEDPRRLLTDLREMLAPGGLIDIRTPNSCSFMAAVFRDAWRGWETPRHLNIFSPASLESLVRSLGGLEVGVLETSNRMAISMALGSMPGGSIGARARRYSIAPLAAALALTWGLCFDGRGEELHATLRRSP